MSYIDLTKTTAPATPSASHAELFVDTADKKLKTIDDAGLILTCSDYPIVRAVLTSDYTSSNASGGTLSDVTGFVFDIAANENWLFEFNLICTGVAGGGKVAVNGPSGATLLASVWGTTSGVTAYNNDPITALNTANATALGTFTTANSTIIKVSGTMRNSTNAGTVQLRGTNVTNSNTFTIKAGSHMIAQRIS